MNRLREESRRVALVREALRRGDGQAASALLDQLRREFPEAVLAQEREALSIETLARQGRRAEARARATTFLNTWPSSVYAETVRLYNQ
jgi:predicted Zn-dependent protease